MTLMLTEGVIVSVSLARTTHYNKVALAKGRFHSDAAIHESVSKSPNTEAHVKCHLKNCVLLAEIEYAPLVDFVY